MDENGEIFVLPFHDLEAVVSEVALEAFAGEEIQRKAQEDLEWIKERAVVHAKVVQEAMGKDPPLLDLIPMKFGIIFEDRDRLVDALEKDYSKMKHILQSIHGKQEWSVKVYLKDRRQFEQTVKEKSETIREKERTLAGLPEGMAFFMEEELKEGISEEFDKELNRIAGDLFDELKKQAMSSVKTKLLGRPLTGREEPMVLNAAYLIPEETMEEFKIAAQRLDHEVQGNGFYLEYSGPWPAYHFTTR
jgi:Gas vesicle synthesis protein GvpL/GvpF